MQPQVLLGYYYKAEPKYNHLKGIEKRTPKDDHMAHSAFAQQTVDLEISGMSMAFVVNRNKTSCSWREWLDPHIE